MPVFLDTEGEPTLGIALCARCSRKLPLSQLYSDPNAPGLMVCIEDLDQLDPYRLAPRPPDNLILPFYRPDVPLTIPGEPPLAIETFYILTEDSDPILSENDDNLVTEAA